MKQRIGILLMLTLCVFLCACVNDNKGMESYVGNTYTGISPWNEPVSITVKKYDEEKNTIDLKYKENIESEHSLCLNWSGAMIGNNSVALACAGSREDDSCVVEYKYEFSIVFKDQAIQLTYLDGQKTELGTEGGGVFHQVSELSEKEKTVILEQN
ncbi:MAG: hypothetical protein MJ127_00610 [Mogibacterium sp.]|nr:hypothetical protein [Mogibacterium sp.]